MATVPTDPAIAFSSSPRVKFSSLRRPPGAHPLSGRSLPFLPSFRGLKVQTPSKLPLVSIRGRNAFRVSQRSRGSIVCEAQETAFDVPSVTDETWQSLVLKADGPVLVEFWAPWCGPCRMVHPVVAELSLQYAAKLKFFKLNTDESPSIATQYGIRSIPTIMMFVNGEKKDAIIGAVPKTTLITTIEKFL